MSEVLDSYTGEPYVEDYVSKIPDIHRGRESFWRRMEMARAAQQYWVSPYHAPEEEPLPSPGPGGTLSPAAPSPADPRSLRERVPSGYLLRRKDSPSDLFPLFPSQEAAVIAMDWCVRNDGSVGVVIHWLLQGNSIPYLNMLQDIVAEITNAGSN